jgi:hypothetical protein
MLALNVLGNQQLLAISGEPLCDVAVHRIRYATVGGANEATSASGTMIAARSARTTKKAYGLT